MPNFVTVIIAAVPASLILYLALNTGVLPDNDYWHILGQIISNSGISLSVEDWLNRSNEHIVILPKLIYLLNYLAYDGSNRGLALAVWLIACVQLFLAIIMVPTAIRKDKLLGPLSVFILASFVFTPSAAHNWIMGMSGAAWITANTFSVAALCALNSYWLTGKKHWFLLSITAACLGFMSYSTSLAIFPALILCSRIMKLRWSVTLLLLALMLFVYAIYFSGLEQLSHHPEKNKSIKEIAIYTISFVGGGFHASTTVSVTAGSFGLLAFPLLAILAFQSRSRCGFPAETAVWFSLAIYCVLNGIMAGISRSGFGLESSLASRYASLPALFWGSLIICCLCYIGRSKTGKLSYSMKVLLALTSLAVLSIHYNGYRVYSDLLVREGHKRLAAISLVTGIYDDARLKASVSPAVHSQLIEQIENLREMNHVPFVKPFIDCPLLGSLRPAVVRRKKDSKEIEGYIESISFFDRSKALVKGWVYTKQQGTICVAITNQEGVVRGVALTGESRADVGDLLNLEDVNAGWSGYMERHSEDKHYRAYAIVGGASDWYEL